MPFHKGKVTQNANFNFVVPPPAKVPEAGLPKALPASFRDSRLLMDFLNGHGSKQRDHDEGMIEAYFAGRLVVTNSGQEPNQAEHYYAPSLTYLKAGMDEEGKPEHRLEGGWVQTPDDITRLASLALRSEEQVVKFEGLPPIAQSDIAADQSAPTPMPRAA